MSTLDREIGLRDIRALKPNEIIWDGGLSGVAGFGARRQRGTSVSYVLDYRTQNGRQRFFTIGRHGSPWTPKTARDRARELLTAVKRGEDPSADKAERLAAKTMTELCDVYLAEAKAGRILLGRERRPKKASTLKVDTIRIERHIKPLLGHLKVGAVTQSDVEQFKHSIADGKGLTGIARGGKTAATRSVGLLGAIFEFAIRQRMRADNPCRGVVKFKDGRRERRLSDAEYKMLGKALNKAQTDGVWPPTVALIKFLALTGWRSSEARELRWADIDLPRRTATFDTKTDQSKRPLSQRACEILERQPRAIDFVFPGFGDNAPLSTLTKPFRELREAAGLSDDITPHVLRHSFGSLANDLGYTDATIAMMLGHKKRTTTGLYQHGCDPVLLAAADRVADETAALMAGGNVVSLEAKRSAR
jgi:integrase